MFEVVFPLTETDVVNTMLASPVPLTFVNVPLAAGAPVWIVGREVKPAIVAVTVNVCPLFDEELFRQQYNYDLLIPLISTIQYLLYLK